MRYRYENDISVTTGSLNMTGKSTAAESDSGQSEEFGLQTRAVGILLRGIQSFQENQSRDHCEWIRTSNVRMRPMGANPVNYRLSQDVAFPKSEVKMVFRRDLEELVADASGVSGDATPVAGLPRTTVPGSDKMVLYHPCP